MSYSPQELRAALSQGVFPGFKLKNPEYHVIVPQTLGEYTIRSLVVSEEQALKGTLTTPRKLPDHLNRILWETIISKPDNIKTYDDFLRQVTVKDRDALVYGLYHITYKDVSNYELTCSKCQRKSQVTFGLSSVFKMDAWPGKPNEIIQKRIEIPLESVEPKASIVIKQPVLLDEKNILDNMLFQSDSMLELGMEMLIVDCFKIMVPNPDGTITPENFLEIREMDQLIKTYKTLPAQDRKSIQKAYVNNFAKYSMELKVSNTCQGCGTTGEIEVDLGTQFFRAIYE